MKMTIDDVQQQSYGGVNTVYFDVIKNATSVLFLPVKIQYISRLNCGWVWYLDIVSFDAA